MNEKFTNEELDILIRKLNINYCTNNNLYFDESQEYIIWSKIDSIEYKILKLLSNESELNNKSLELLLSNSEIDIYLFINYFSNNIISELTVFNYLSNYNIQINNRKEEINKLLLYSNITYSENVNGNLYNFLNTLNFDIKNNFNKNVNELVFDTNNIIDDETSFRNFRTAEFKYREYIKNIEIIIPTYLDNTLSILKEIINELKTKPILLFLPNENPGLFYNSELNKIYNYFINSKFTKESDLFLTEEDFIKELDLFIEFLINKVKATDFQIQNYFYIYIEAYMDYREPSTLNDIKKILFIRIFNNNDSYFYYDMNEIYKMIINIKNIIKEDKRFKERVVVNDL